MWMIPFQLPQNMNTYRMDVEGMKQVRWPGINMANLGGVFTDENGKVIKTFKMSISNAPV